MSLSGILDLPATCYGGPVNCPVHVGMSGSRSR